MALTLDCDAARAYAVLAPAYDLFAAECSCGPWRAGLSFMPLLARGFEVTACDISPEMVAEARHTQGRVRHATRGEFAMIWRP